MFPTAPIDTVLTQFKFKFKSMSNLDDYDDCEFDELKPESLANHLEI